MKINFDAAMNDNSRSNGFGVIIRDEEGFVLAAKAMRGPIVLDSFIAEARTMRSAVEFAMKLGFIKVQIEGDALSIIKSVNSLGEDLWVRIFLLWD